MLPILEKVGEILDESVEEEREEERRKRDQKNQSPLFLEKKTGTQRTDMGELE